MLHETTDLTIDRYRRRLQMRTPTEGQFAIGLLALLALWVFAVLPLMSGWPQRATNFTSTRSVASAHRIAGSSDQGGGSVPGDLNEGTEFWPTLLGMRLKITDSLLVIFNFGLLIATVMLWRSTEKLWAAGERQLAHLSDTAERQLRAYVNNASGVIRNVAAGKIVEVEIQIKNSGQTPAYNVRHWSQITLAHFPWKETVPFGSSLSSSTLGAGAAAYNLVRLEPPLSEAHLVGLLTGAYAIYVEGRVDYVDAFQQARFTMYRFFVGGDRGFPPNDALYTDSHGNDAN